MPPQSAACDESSASLNSEYSVPLPEIIRLRLSYHLAIVFLITDHTPA